jgi:hypothetical protein
MKTTSYVPSTLSGLTPSQTKAFKKLNDLLSSNVVARWQFGHGYISEKPKPKHAALACGIPEADAKAELGKVSRILNECVQSGLLSGNVTAARATVSGKVNATIADTVLGMALSASMESLCADAVATMLGGGAPAMLLVPSTSKHDTVVTVDKQAWKYDFRLARIALAECGVNVSGLKSSDIPALVDGVVKDAKKADKAKPRKARKESKPAASPENVTPITDGHEPREGAVLEFGERKSA